MKPHLLILSALAAASAPLCAASSQTELAELQQIDVPDTLFHHEEGELDAEARSVVEHYIRTGDATYASSPRALTMLHIAALAKCPQLVEELLRKGANPHACMKWENGDDGLSVRRFVLAHYAPAVSADYAARASRCLQLLQAAGVDILESEQEQNFCNLCYPEDATPEQEELAMELMRLGARVTDAAACYFAACGWKRALTRLMESEGGEAFRKSPYLIHFAVESFCKAPAGAVPRLQHLSNVLDTARLILQLPEPEARPPLDRCSALLELARHLPKPEGEPAAWFAQQQPLCALYADFMALLMESGADPLKREELDEVCSAADFISVCDWAQAMLRERGHQVTPRPVILREEQLLRQLRDLPREMFTPEFIQSRFDTLALLFSPTSLALPSRNMRVRELMDAFELYCDALGLLHQADAARTERLLRDFPDWDNAHAWATDPLFMRAILAALHDNEGIVLPADILVNAARKLAEDGQPQAAHACVRLLARCPEAGPLIEELCAEDTPLPLRAAAWSLRLQGEGLPFLSNEGLPLELSVLDRDLQPFTTSEGERLEQLLKRPRQPLSPILHRLLRIANCMHSYRMHGQLPFSIHCYPERLFFEGYVGYSRDEKGPFPLTIEAMREIGAPLAAELLADMAEALPDAFQPDPSQHELTRPHGRATAASLELELAFALCVWENRESLREEINRLTAAP